MAQVEISSRGVFFNPIRGEEPSLTWVPIDMINVDETYQRSLEAEASKSLVRKIASEWDWGLCPPLELAKRPDGSLWVVDGQHRLTGATMRGDIPKLPSFIRKLSSVAEEAALFVSLNKSRRALGAVDVFKANLAAGDVEALEVHQLILDSGLVIAKHSNYNCWEPGQIYCVPGIAAGYKKYGKTVTSSALIALSEAFDGKVLRYAGTLLRSLLRFYSIKLKDKNFDPDSFIEALSFYSQEQWIRRAAEQTSLTGDPQIVALTQCFLKSYDVRAGSKVMLTS